MEQMEEEGRMIMPKSGIEDGNVWASVGFCCCCCSCPKEGAGVQQGYLRKISYGTERAYNSTTRMPSNFPATSAIGGVKKTYNMLASTITEEVALQ